MVKSFSKNCKIFEYMIAWLETYFHETTYKNGRYEVTDCSQRFSIPSVVYKWNYKSKL